MSARHTPGPWTFGYYGCNGYCINGGGKHIATSVLYKAEGGEANARLISAAPDLLEALKSLDARLRECTKAPITAAEAYDSFYQELVSEAISKATGEAA